MSAPPPPGPPPPEKKSKLAACQEKVEEQRAKLRAKFGDEKVGKGEKIVLIILIFIVGCAAGWVGRAVAAY